MTTPTNKKPCDRIYPTEGAFTGRIKDGIAVCTYCNVAVKEHKHE
jgi:hypothetical protein